MRLIVAGGYLIARGADPSNRNLPAIGTCLSSTRKAGTERDRERQSHSSGPSLARAHTQREIEARARERERERETRCFAATTTTMDVWGLNRMIRRELHRSGRVGSCQCVLSSMSNSHVRALVVPRVCTLLILTPLQTHRHSHRHRCRHGHSQRQT